MADDPQLLQHLCSQGSAELARTEYLAAERTLERAEEHAWRLGDFETLARLLFPLQETRRQIRQRCGEGVVRWDLVARGPGDTQDPAELVRRYPHGQLLVAGWRSFAVAGELRRRYREADLYGETFLAAAFPTTAGAGGVAAGGGGAGIVVVVAAREYNSSHLPQVVTAEELGNAFPGPTVILDLATLPPGEHSGTPATYARVMELWERLHRPLVQAASALPDSVGKLRAFRDITLQVDRACELAHQLASETARVLGRGGVVGMGGVGSGRGG
jgi:hypothetical protein